MANKNLLKKIGLGVIGCIIVFGVMLFVFRDNTQPDTVPTYNDFSVVQEVEQTEEVGTVASGLYAENSDLGIGTEEAITEEYTVAFYDANNEDIVVESGSMVTVPEYERQKLINLAPTIFENFSVDSEDFEILSTRENTDGTKTHHVKILSDSLTNNVTTQYSVDKETNKAKALFVYQVPVQVGVSAEDFGLTFEITENTDGTVAVDKILDLFGQEANNIEVYAGDCVGWSLSKWAVDYDFEFGVEIAVQQNVDLYPVMDLTNAAIEGEDLTQGVWVNSYNGTAIRMCAEYNEIIVDDNYQVREGNLVTLDGSKIVDTETGVVSDKPVEVKQEENKPTTTEQTDSTNVTTETEQNSTVGNTGHTAPTGETGQINDGSQGEAQIGMGHENAAAKFGATYLGSGFDTSGFDHGDGGYSFTFE